MNSGAQTINWKRNLVGIWIGQILCMAGFSSIIPFVPLFIRDKYHITDEKELGMWVAALTFFGLSGFCFSSPVWGILADRLGRKLMLLRAYYVSAFLFPMMYFAPSVVWLIVIRFFVTIFSGVTTAAQTLIVSTTPKEHHGVALGTLSTAIWSGNMIGFLAGALFVNTFGYFWGFMCCGAMFMIGGLVTHIMVKEHFVPPEKKPNGGSVFSTFKGLHAAIWIILVLFLAMGMARRLDEPYISLLVSQLSAPDKAVFYTGLISLAAALGGLVSGIVIGKMCDRFSPASVAVPAVLIASGTMAVQAFASGLWMLGGARFIHFTAAGGLEPAFQAMLAKICPEGKQGTLLGLASSIRIFGILLSAALSGGIIWLFGSVRAVFLGSVILFLLLLPLIFLAAANIKNCNQTKETSV